MSYPKIPPDLQPIIDFHGHLCPGLVLGYRAAKAGMKRIHAMRSEDEELVAIVENDSCAVDAIQFMTGCTFGKGNFFFRDHGKHVYTLALRPHGRGVRVSLKGDVFREEGRDKRIEQILSMDEKELFDVQDVTVDLPQQARIHTSVPCSRCGEPVMETRVMEKDGKGYCIPCYHELP
ncbi:MAG: FmdE family protein [ANME-2 cluster archaeon]|nr:FmdE family protein [ANME-2 cluster archaeon]